jgi:hypothetical protein
MHLHASWLLMSLTNALKRIFRKGIMNKLKIRIERIFVVEKMWFCHLFSKYESLNYYYLIFLSRISTRFISYAFCHIFFHSYEIKRNFCEKVIFYRITSSNIVESGVKHQRKRSFGCEFHNSDFPLTD